MSAASSSSSSVSNSETASKRRVVRVGGVDEHFNLPWKLAIEAGAFETLGVDLVWHDCPGGTGEKTERTSFLFFCVAKVNFWLVVKVKLRTHWNKARSTWRRV
jgi:hypothetical protein